MVRFRELYKGEKEPVLLSGRTCTGRSGDQYYFIYVTSTGQLVDQYWFTLPPFWDCFGVPVTLFICSCI